MDHWYHGDCPLYLWIIQTQTSIRLMTTGSSKKEEKNKWKNRNTINYGGILDKIVHSIHTYICRIEQMCLMNVLGNKYDFVSVVSMEISTSSSCDIICHLIALSRLFVTWFCMSTVCSPPNDAGFKRNSGRITGKESSNLLWGNVGILFSTREPPQPRKVHPQAFLFEQIWVDLSFCFRADDLSR